MTYLYVTRKAHFCWLKIFFPFFLQVLDHDTFCKSMISVIYVITYIDKVYRERIFATQVKGKCRYHQACVYFIYLFIFYFYLLLLLIFFSIYLMGSFHARCLSENSPLAGAILWLLLLFVGKIRETSSRHEMPLKDLNQISIERDISETS